jgi:DNA (cytosine-5)-methyltransferase 1
MADEDNEVVEQDLIDLTLEDRDDGSHQKPRAREEIRGRLEVQQPNITAGDFVQIDDTTIGCYTAEFILVNAISRSGGNQHAVRGVPFARTRRMLGKLPKKLNEVCTIHYFSNALQKTARMPFLVEVLISSVHGKRLLITTNALYPIHNPKLTTFTNIEDPTVRATAIEEHGTLVCRWKVEVSTFSECPQSRPIEEVVSRIFPEEVTERRYRVNEANVLRQWRGETIKGGSWTPRSDKNATLDEKEHGLMARRRGQRYTLFDSFCGAGGVSRGAALAGFHIQHAVDKSPNVWATYQANFPHTSLYMGSVDDFIQNSSDSKTKVDVLHLSPPCQPFSPAHTREAAHDDDNRFALMGCFALIKMTRPRIVTLEQTFGITHQRHGEYLRTLINDFTSQGFSVRWQIVRLATWGSAQDRKRLILIASAPGERLPPFPAPSHSDNGHGGLKPFNTIAKALSCVAIGDVLHDLDNVRYHEPRKAPFSANRLAGTITTSPGGFYYPDGTRDLTMREFACLQGFPAHHTFEGTKTSILRQIGNAFPPNTVRHLYKHIENWLLKQDDMTTFVPKASEVIDVDSAGTTPRSGRRRRLMPFSSRVQPQAPVAVDQIDVEMADCKANLTMGVIDLT